MKNKLDQNKYLILVIILTVLVFGVIIFGIVNVTSGQDDLSIGKNSIAEENDTEEDTVSENTDSNLIAIEDEEYAEESCLDIGPLIVNYEEDGKYEYSASFYEGVDHVNMHMIIKPDEGDVVETDTALTKKTFGLIQNVVEKSEIDDSVIDDDVAVILEEFSDHIGLGYFTVCTVIYDMFDDDCMTLMCGTDVNSDLCAFDVLRFNTQYTKCDCSRIVFDESFIPYVDTVVEYPNFSEQEYQKKLYVILSDMLFNMGGQDDSLRLNQMQYQFLQNVIDFGFSVAYTDYHDKMILRLSEEYRSN